MSTPQLKAVFVFLALVILGVGCRTEGERLVEEAHRALAEDDYEAAVRLFHEVTLRFPETPLAPEAHYQLAQIYYLRLRDVDAAHDALWKILTDHPDSAPVLDAHRLLARLYERDLQQPDKALRHYRAIAELDNEADARREALLSIAGCHYRLNQLERSRASYRAVLELPYHPDADAAYFRLANLEWILGAPDESLRLLRDLQARTDDAQHRYQGLVNELEALTSLGRFQAARERLVSARKSYPDSQELTELEAKLEAVERQHRSLVDEDQAALLEELQKKIRWGAGRRRR